MTSPNLLTGSPEDVVVAVLGANVHGTGIARVAARAGHPVILVDAQDGAADRARRQMRVELDRLVSKGRIDPATATDLLNRVEPLSARNMSALPPVSLAIENTVEKIDVKRELIRQLEDHQPSTTVIASTTTLLSLEDVIGESTTGHDAALRGGHSPALRYPEYLVGLHFFQPPTFMRLVEVVTTSVTADEVADAVVALIASWDKVPVRCHEDPGRIVNRATRPFTGEAVRLLAEGVADPATIDLMMRQAGFPVGPFLTDDLVGHDVMLATTENLWERTDRDPRYEPTELQRRLVREGRLGQKAGRGWFDYTGEDRPDDRPDEELAERLRHGPITTDPVARTLAMLVNEACDVVDRGVASEEDVRIAMRLGAQFPDDPFTWLDRIGAGTVITQLRELDATYPGGRYRPSPGLLARARR